MKDPKVGDTVDRRYLLKREIARGGAGVVFEAEHLFTSSTVAVKLLFAEKARDSGAVRRLLREARALSLARHPNVVSVLDAGASGGGIPYLVMEMLEGRSLDGILAARRTLPLADTVHVGRQICDALAFAHAHGVIHRDIKPSNVFFAKNEVGAEVVKLLDFGIAALVGDQASARDDKLTQDNTLLGTPEYMAPEQLMARDDVDHRCDVYSAGATLYECLTGSVPFSGNYPTVLLQVSTLPIPPLHPRRPELPPAFAAAVEKALARDANDRFPDAWELSRALIASSGVAPGQSSLLGIRALPPLPATSSSGPVSRAMFAPESESSPPSSVLRRRSARAPYVTPVRVMTAEGPHLDGHSEDISEGGLLVMLPQLVKAAAPVKVQLAVPLTGNIVVLDAVARWVRSGRGSGILGLEFVSLPDAVRASITRYVEMLGGTL